jgi:hypothetical protein
VYCFRRWFHFVVVGLLLLLLVLLLSSFVFCCRCWFKKEENGFELHKKIEYIQYTNLSIFQHETKQKDELNGATWSHLEPPGAA